MRDLRVTNAAGNWRCVKKSPQAVGLRAFSEVVGRRGLEPRTN